VICGGPQNELLSIRRLPFRQKINSVCRITNRASRVGVDIYTRTKVARTSDWWRRLCTGLLPVWCEELGRLLMLRHDPGKSRPLSNHATTTINAQASVSSMTSGAAAAAAATGLVLADPAHPCYLLIPTITVLLLFLL